jgi:transposase
LAKSIKKIDAFKLVPLDESSVNLAYSRAYGRAPTTDRIKEGRKDMRFERKSVLSTFRLNGSICPLVFSGTLTKELFAESIERQLKPTRADGDILLLDNSSVHRSKLVVNTLRACNLTVLWLPRYSPDYNPIDLLWSYMKSILRKLKARTHDALENAINFARGNVPTDRMIHWFNHCGYSVNL